MGNHKKLAAPKVDGVEIIEQEALVELFNEEEVLDFEYTRRDGKKVELQMLVSASRVEDKSLRDYLRKVNGLQREAEQRAKAAASMEALATQEAPVAGASAAPINDSDEDALYIELYGHADGGAEDVDKGDTTAEVDALPSGAGSTQAGSTQAGSIHNVSVQAAESFTSDNLDALSEHLDLMAQLAQLDAELLQPALIPVPEAGHNGWTVPGVEPTVNELAKMKGVGAAARERLRSWFFPTSDEPEAEIGVTETPSTPATSPTSEATAGSEVTPTISQPTI